MPAIYIQSVFKEPNILRNVEGANMNVGNIPCKLF